MSYRIVLVLGLEADQRFGKKGRELTEAVLTRVGAEARQQIEGFASPEGWGNPGNGNVRVVQEIRSEGAEPARRCRELAEIILTYMDDEGGRAWAAELKEIAAQVEGKGWRP